MDTITALWAAVAGKKTYCVAAASVAAAWLGVYTGAVSSEAAAQITVTSILGSTVHHRIDNPKQRK